jgi:catechol 2,3-dioxygenase-like lactoylglutathione lyase family enzyme
VIAVEDVAFVRVRAPDLDLMESFLSDFGLSRVTRTETALYVRGCGPEPVVHITERGEAQHVGFALRVASRADLETVAAHVGLPVESRTEPGGGFVLKLIDPDGNQVELVHGIAPIEGAASRKPHPLNPALDRTRHNQTIRNEAKSSHVQRLGHVALHARDFGGMMSFYCDMLGMKVSDSYYAGEPGKVMAAFLHCGLGEKFVDHHSVALIGDGRTGFDHFAYEVLDFDDLMMGNRYLIEKGRWQHSWGVGRHRDGSQIFDYWRDPFGNKIEHWTDGDLVNDAYQSSNSPFSPELAAEQLSQWGPPLTPDFMR